MTRWVPVVCLALAFGSVFSTHASARQATPRSCSGAAECRQQTEAAIARGDYELSHDLAWRAVQQGPRSDPALMYMLARAQAFSGRPDDALVMLRRLAEMGVAADVTTDEFIRTRDLPGWPAVEALITRVGRPVDPPSPNLAVRSSEVVSLSAAVPAIPPAPAVSATVEPATRAAARPPPIVEDAGRFSSREFAPGGLACDAASRRFVFGDQAGRKLRIVAEGGTTSIDLTRAESAGFRDVTALDIDTTTGNLWVASAEAASQVATLHKLQLNSGRALASYNVPDGLAPVWPVDLTVTASGAVFLLDAAQGRVLVLRPRAPALEVLTSLKVDAPASLTVSRRDEVAYVAHRAGLLRIDLRTRVVSPLTGSNGIALGGIEWLRRYARGFVGVQALPDSSRRFVSLALHAAGRTITGLQVIDVPLPSGTTPTFATVCGDTLAFLIGEAGGTADQPATEWTVRRIRLEP